MGFLLPKAAAGGGGGGLSGGQQRLRQHRGGNKVAASLDEEVMTSVRGDLHTAQQRIVMSVLHIFGS